MKLTDTVSKYSLSEFQTLVDFEQWCKEAYRKSAQLRMQAQSLRNNEATEAVHRRLWKEFVDFIKHGSKKK